jgi:hypothetical protein
MSTLIDLEELYSKVMPYISDPLIIKEFLDDFNHNEIEKKELVEAVEKRLIDSQGTIRTDFRIILNTINQFQSDN